MRQSVPQPEAAAPGEDARSAGDESARRAALRLIVTGHVQAVGFRPFVYRLAHRHRVAGWVQNQTGQVEIHVEGPVHAVAAFERDLIDRAPPLARPAMAVREETVAGGFGEFAIRQSAAAEKPRIFVPPDYFLCDDCRAELDDPDDRRYRYPFINCTQCGPRYTLIRALPYDRPNTTLAAFELCPACRAEYEDPLDRRFHAEPVACADCGPAVAFHAADGEKLADDEAALELAIAQLKNGLIVAVKGVGGYHLMCDARDDEAVRRLRARKNRPDKPLAVMFPERGADGLDALAGSVDLSAQAAALVRSPLRPIVLATTAMANRLAPSIAPGLGETGVFLPYSPLHHLLLKGFGGPLVATSGNLSGEPVLTDNDEAGRRLATIADGFLQHNRPIERPADDPVFREVGAAMRPIRIGRGTAPLELALPFTLDRPVLAVGGHMKNTLALAWEDRVVVSPHIGDMDSPRSLDVFEQVGADLQRLYGVTAEAIVGDEHPGYTTSRWARRQGLPFTTVLHHHAHASALAAEHDVERDWLMFAWDGVGFGADGTLWGGETFWGRPGQWQRVASLRPFRLPGGDKAGREPWRSACGACWDAGLDWPRVPDPQGLARAAWERGLNAPQTSAAGRLFDAAAALVLGRTHASFEGQGPMELEAVAAGAGTGQELEIGRDGEGLRRIDWRPLLRLLLDDAIPAAQRAFAFHDSLARTIVRVVALMAEERNVGGVGLTGGVFQNRLLADLVCGYVRERGLDVVQSIAAPCNDAGLSYGQVVEYGAGG
jgi:hydrogenase maturation protein HypF